MTGCSGLAAFWIQTGSVDFCCPRGDCWSWCSEISLSTCCESVTVIGCELVSGIQGLPSAGVARAWKKPMFLVASVLLFPTWSNIRTALRPTTQLRPSRILRSKWSNSRRTRNVRLWASIRSTFRTDVASHCGMERGLDFRGSSVTSTNGPREPIGYPLVAMGVLLKSELRVRGIRV
jgi:hypothetical protein